MRKIASLLAMLMLFCALAYAQTRTITGVVRDDKGDPVPFATVSIVGTKNAVTADQNGRFTIQAAENARLTISATGFDARTVSASDASSILMSRTDTQMQEVIVTGVAGATTRKKMTVSVTKVSEDRLKAVPAQSMVSALSGKVAGIKTSSPSGAPGGNVDLQLRGDNNLNVGSGPLIIIDGVITNGSLSDINADDVESMEVVKGAAASALYGSRAGNGVIAITTKRGNRQGINTTTVNVRNEVGFQSLGHKLDLATHHPYKLASDWESAKGQYTKFDGVTYPNGYSGAGYHPGISGNRTIDADHYLDNPYGVVRDQQAELFQTGVNYTNYIGVGSRSEKTNIYASFENNAQEGVIKFTNGYKRQNYRLNLDHQLTSWLKFSTSNLFINTSYQYPGNGAGVFFNIVLAEPDVDLNQTNPDGQPYYVRMEQFNGDVSNPLYNLYKQQRDDKKRRWIGNYTANVKFTPWANLDLTHAMEIENYRYTSMYPKDYWNPTGGTAATNGMAYTNGSLYKFSAETKSQNDQATLNLGNRFGNLDVKGKLSYLYEKRNYENYDVSASQFSYADVPRFANFKGIDNADSRIEEEIAQNYFAIASLGWKDKYLLDGMFRYDGSSLFGPEARWNAYYRISGAYRISEDVKIPGIDELKIRAAHGTAGIRPGFDWQYETFNLSGGVAAPRQLGNLYLKPSKTAETEVGLNVDFLKRFSFEATYAKSQTTDQFLNVKLIPFILGAPRQWQNAGAIKSNTIEMSLDAKWLKARDFTWSSNLVFSRVRQEITDLPIPPYLFGSTDGGGSQMFYVRGGESYGAMYGYDWVRSLDQMAKQLPNGKSISDYELNSDGYVVLKGTQGTKNEAAIKLRDEKGDLWYGKIGNGNPDFNMGISNNFGYKGLTLYFLFDIKKGGDVYNQKAQWITRDFRNSIMDMSGVADGQKKAYDYFLNFYDVNTINSYWVEDASYVKLREISLGYSLPKKVLGNLKNVVKGATVKVIGRNLLTFTDYTGYDPEVGSLREPYDGTYKYPNFRNVAFSLSLDF